MSSKKKLQTNEYIKMYQLGFSTYQIARKFNKLPNTITSVLGYWNIPKRHLGDDIENKVMDWVVRKKHIVIHQKGNQPYDLLVDGEKVDVKSAHLSYDKWNKNYSYLFQLQDRYNRITQKNLQKEIDAFYLVFLDELRQPIYKLLSQDVEAKQSLRIPYSLDTKYPISLIGYLESKKGGVQDGSTISTAKKRT